MHKDIIYKLYNQYYHIVKDVDVSTLSTLEGLVWNHTLYHLHLKSFYSYWPAMFCFPLLAVHLLSCIPKVVSALLPSGGWATCSRWAVNAPSISVKVFYIGSSSFLVSSATCLVALTIGWKRVGSLSPIASFNSRFAILRCLTVFIAVTYSLTRVALSAGSLISRNDMLPVLLHTQTNDVWARTCICIEETGIS